jgi:hypothetical protein
LQKLGLPILNPWSIIGTIVIIGIATIGTGIIGTTGVTAKSKRTLIVWRGFRKPIR